jgi:hypothetical protein
MRINPNHIGTMEVCVDCRDIVGLFHRLNGDPRGQSALVQRGSCPRHAAQAGEPSWSNFDFNRQVDLCYCCGTVPLSSGSRWSVWFCDECKEQVGLLNGRHGRCIVPIGRHSVHTGHLLRGEEVDDPIAVQIFFEATTAAHTVIGMLSNWCHIAIGGNLEAIDATMKSVTPIKEYCRKVHDHVDPMDRFREMCEYLAERGRTAPTGENK